MQKETLGRQSSMILSGHDSVVSGCGFAALCCLHFQVRCWRLEPKLTDDSSCLCPPAGDKRTFNKGHKPPTRFFPPTTRVQQIPGVGLI
jgi:hypothetical protein